MSEDQPNPQSSAPTSWRDVYQLVQDSEKRLTATITDGFQRQSAVSQDHEVRLRVLEASDQRDSASNRAVTQVFGAGRATLIVLLSVASLLLSALSILAPK
jgi:hypothetical protein